MSSSAQDYIDSLPEDRQQPFSRLLATIRESIPAGFTEVMTGCPAFVVPLSTFPAGYHCSPNTPLPYVSLASQKNFIALHHFGIYMNPQLTRWLIDEYPRHVTSKLDMGKSCIRFKRMDQIPFELVGQLLARQSMEDFISGYQGALNPDK